MVDYTPPSQLLAEQLEQLEQPAADGALPVRESMPKPVGGRWWATEHGLKTFARDGDEKLTKGPRQLVGHNRADLERAAGPLGDYGERIPAGHRAHPDYAEDECAFRSPRTVEEDHREALERHRTHGEVVLERAPGQSTSDRYYELARYPKEDLIQHLAERHGIAHLHPATTSKGMALEYLQGLEDDQRHDAGDHLARHPHPRGLSPEGRNHVAKQVLWSGVHLHADHYGEVQPRSIIPGQHEAVRRQAEGLEAHVRQLRLEGRGHGELEGARYTVTQLRSAAGHLHNLADAAERLHALGEAREAAVVHGPAAVGGATTAAEKPTAVKGAMVAFYLQPHVTSYLRALGGDEPEERMHVTLAYLGDAAALGEYDRLKLTGVLRRVAQDWAHLVGRLSGLALFNPSEGSDGLGVRVALVDVPGLCELRADLTEQLRRVDLPMHDEHGFCPHVSLGYVDGAREWTIHTIVPMEVVLAQLVLVLGAEEQRYQLLGSSTIGR